MMREIVETLGGALSAVEGLRTTLDNPYPGYPDHRALFDPLQIPYRAVSGFWVTWPREDEDEDEPDWMCVDVSLDERSFDRSDERSLHRGVAEVLAEQSDVPLECEHPTDLITQLWYQGFDERVRTFMSLPWKGQTLRLHFCDGSRDLHPDSGQPWILQVVETLEKRQW